MTMFPIYISEDIFSLAENPLRLFECISENDTEKKKMGMYNFLQPFSFLFLNI